MFHAFDRQGISHGFCHHTEPLCIAKALADLQSDLRKISGQEAEIKPCLPRDENG